MDGEIESGFIIVKLKIMHQKTLRRTVQKKGFTLIELSVVIVIIGILVTGIMQGANMVQSSRLSSARAITAKSPIIEIEGLTAWYETSKISSLELGETIDEREISTWFDGTPGSTIGLLKENELTRTASTDIVYENIGINKIPSLHFSNAGNLTLANLYQGSSAQSTVFLVFRPLASPSSTEQILFDAHTSASDSSSIGIKNNAICLNAASGSVCTATTTNAAAFSVNKDYIVSAYFNNTASRAFVNDPTNKAGAADIAPGSNELVGLTIGTNKSGASAFIGLISEVIIYNRPLKLQERKDVMTYLSKKYKVTLTGL